MNFNKFFTYFTIIRLEGDVDKMGLSWCCKNHCWFTLNCVMVWTLFIVFSFCLSTKSKIFFSPATKRVAPGYFYWKMEEK